LLLVHTKQVQNEETMYKVKHVREGQAVPLHQSSQWEESGKWEWEV